MLLRKIEIKLEVETSANPSLATDAALEELNNRIGDALDKVNFGEIVRNLLREAKIGGIKVKVEE
jgi:hypothetical protein